MTAYQLEVLIANCIITFNAAFGAGQTSLEISYVFENRTGRPAVIFNMLNEPGEHPALVDPSRVSIWPKGERLEIAKMAYAPPPDTLLESLYVPMATVVAPGARFAETIRIGLPFRLWHPYFDRSEVTPDELSRLDAIRFRLGFFLADPAYLDSLELVRLADRTVARIPVFDPDHQEIAEFTMPVEGLPEMIAPR